MGPEITDRSVGGLLGAWKAARCLKRPGPTRAAGLVGLFVLGLSGPASVMAQPSMLDEPLTQVVAGQNHSCALTTAGGVKCWGFNDHGQLGDNSTTQRLTPVGVSGLASGVASLSLGAFHTCALTVTGGVKCWGYNGYGGLGDGSTADRLTPVDVSGLTDGVALLAAGYGHTCALTTAGGVKCWGFNQYGALGDNSTTQRLTPVEVSGLASGVAGLAGGSNHTCALTAAGGVKCWGYNRLGELGDNSTTDRLTAVDVFDLTSGVVSLVAGAFHTCVVSSTGGVKCWGRNGFGQLGDNSGTDRPTPVGVWGLSSGVARLAKGDYHTCALTTIGGVKCWGNNGYGGLGDGTTTHRSTPVDVSGLGSGVAGLAAGNRHTCALTTSGGLKCWGGNGYGELGDNSTTNRLTPVDVSGLSSGVAALATGKNHSCALTTTGGVKCWGSNGQGQLGDLLGNRSSPGDVSGLTSGVAGLGGGWDHSCALTATGGVKCWGRNGEGELGDNSTTDRPTPGDVSGLTTGVAGLATGADHNCALTTTGGVKCWGYNVYGQLGDNSTTDRLAPVDVSGLTSGVAGLAAGGGHTCALTTTGGVKCWGSNAYGQLGDSSATDRLTPVDVSGLTSGVAGLVAGGSHTCALTTAGGVKCWGYNFVGQLGDNSTTDRPTPVDVSGLSSGVVGLAAGGNHTCALTTTGGVKCWGFNHYGRLGDNSTTNRLTPVDVSGLTSGVAGVAAGDGHTCALTTAGGVNCWGYNYYGQAGDDSTTNRLAPVALRFTQSSAFTSPTSLTVGSPTTLSASATSGLSVMFDTWTPGACTITGNSVTATATALCGIRASQPGDGNNAPAPQVLRLVSVAAAAPTVATPTKAAVTVATATLGGNVTSDGGSGITGRGVVYALTSANSDPVIGGSGVTQLAASGTTGVFTADVSALSGSSSYSYRAYATNAIGTAYSAVDTFTTQAPVVSINDVTMAEGTSGSADATFTVTLSAASGQTVTVSAATSNGTAISGGATTSFSFSPATSVSVPGGAYSLGVGRFNTGNAMDLATGSGSILRGDGLGGFTVSHSGGGGYAIAVGDFNGDGVSDVAAAPHVGAPVSVRLGNGSGGLGPASDYAVTSPRAAVAADFNGDGNQDLAVASEGTPEVSILLGDGLGGFGAATKFATGVLTTDTAAVATGDFNGDGKTDLVLGSPGGSAVKVLLGNGLGGFGSPASFATGSRPQSVAVGDLNEDGKQDLAVANGNSGTVSILLGDGAGSFAPAISVAVGSYPNSVVISDLNGDGRQDVASANHGSTNVSVILGDGGGGFSAASTFAVLASPATIVASDLNGDGLTDLATAGNGSVSVLLNTSSLSGDYAPMGPTTLTFNPGETTKTFLVPVHGDTLDEANETFTVGLSAATNATISAASGLGTITDDDASPALSVNDVTVTEGNAGTVMATFTVSLSAESGQTITVSAATSNGTGVAGLDYTATGPTTITFNPGETAKTFTVPVIGDLLDEVNETFAVTLSDPTNATLATATGTGTITDDDATPTLSINDVAVTEGNSGSADATFTVALSAASGQTVTVSVATSNGTGTAVADYTATGPTTITFNPGETTKAFTVPVIGDLLDEANETFTVTLSAPTNATLATATGTGTITDDDATPTLSINDVTVTEGNSGPVTASFTVSLSEASGQTVTVSAATSNGTATATGSTPSVSFSPATSVSVPGGAYALGVGRFNADSALDLATGSGSILQGSGSGGFTVSHTGGFGHAIAVGDFNGDGISDVAAAPYVGSPVSIRLGNGSGGLGAASDYAVTSPRAAVVADFNGDGSQDLAVASEGTPEVSILLGNGLGGFGPATKFATGVLTADTASVAAGDFNGDGKVDLALGSPGGSAVKVLLGNGVGGFGSPASFATGSRPQSVAVGDLNADGKQDLVAANGNSGTVSILLGDGAGSFAPAINVAVGAYPNSVVIGDLNGDGKQDVATANHGSSNVSVILGIGAGAFSAATNFAVPESPATIVAADLNGDGRTDLATAWSGISVLLNTSPFAGDYVAAGPTTLSFNAGETTKTFLVTVNGDTLDEVDETFMVTLSAPSNATLAKATGTGTITDDDATPTLSINDVTLTEGNAGTATGTFTVSLSAASGQTVTVSAATSNGTATAGADYTATGPTTITFSPGETAKTFTVPVIGDLLDEVNETFTVTLSAPSNATLATATGTGTITDDDATPTLSINDVAVTEGNSGLADATFTVTLSAASGQTVTVAAATSNGTGTAGLDYTATGPTTIIFSPGNTTKTFTVAVIGDLLDEVNETFTVTLSGATNATLATVTGTGTITDDDATPTLSINDVAVTEGDSGSVDATFTVTLSAASGQTVAVSAATSNGTATAGADYTATGPTTITFSPGETAKTFTVSVIGDLLDEVNETFTVTLSGASNATMATVTGIGTITDDDATPTLSINDVAVTEGDSGSADATFTVALSAASGQTVTVSAATSNGTATTGSDYTATGPTTITFNPGDTTKSFTVPVTGDLLNEVNETFTVTLSDPGNATLATATGTGTITDDDATPTLSINDVAVTEGDSGSVDATFTVTLSSASGQTVAVSAATSNGTAAAGSDYTATGPTTITFNPGDTTKTFTVPVTGDLLDETNETFTVTLSGATNATLATVTGIGTIADDDATPSLSIDDVTVTEGDAGLINASFTVSLSAASGQAVTVSASTGNDSATGATTSTTVSNNTAVTIPSDGAGPASATPYPSTISVTGVGPVAKVTVTLDGFSHNSSRDVDVLLVGPTGQSVVLMSDVGQGGASNLTLTFDDAAPLPMSVGALLSGTYLPTNLNDGEGSETFNSPAPSGPYGSALSTFAGLDANGIWSLHVVDDHEGEGGVIATGWSITITSAVAGSDFVPTSSTLVFGPGETSKQLVVPVVGDLRDEVDEQFAVGLSDATNATISNATGLGTITDDDEPPTLSISDVTVTEGNAGTTMATFTVSLSAPSGQSVTVSVATADGTAVSPSDYTAVGPSTLTFAPGDVTKTFSVSVNGDTLDEPVETFAVGLSNATNATISVATGVGTIANDDLSTVTISVADVSASEGYVSTGVMKFLVLLSAPATRAVTLEYATSDGTAIAGSDYVAVAGQLAFAIGERSRFIEVVINGDRLEEQNETFILTLSNPVGASFTRAIATGTILNDDESSIRVTDARSWDWTASRFGEGTGEGTSDLRFNIWTSKVLADRDIYVDYTTVDGTATAGSDYTAVSGTAMIPRGQAVAQVIVPVTRDSAIESNETLIFRISNPVGASIYKTDGTGTIVADDGLAVSIADKSMTEGSNGTSPMTFTLTLNAAHTAPFTVDWATVDGTATAPEDYTAASGRVTFGVGQTTKTITVHVVGDLIAEPYETFTVQLSNPVGGLVGDGEATGTLVNTDGISAQFRLMFHNTADNHLYRWHFRKQGVALPALDTFNWVTPWGPDADWNIGTVADFDRDGNLDYLWHNYNSGQMLFWNIDGDNLKGFKFQNYTMDSLRWRVATTMDANGDGELDVIYFDEATGVIRVVLCDNGDLVSTYDLTTTLGGSWRAVAAADVDGDGAEDLIQYNSSIGAIRAWKLSGVDVTGTLAYADTQTTPSQFRLVSARADFNADGKPDFLWHNTTTGYFLTWAMDGTTKLSVGQFESPFDRTDPTWRLVGAATLWQ